MNEILDWALKYAKHGFSVIPIGRDKKPLIEWKKYQSERADEKQVREWFDKEMPPNIGIVTGKISQLTVVDVENGGKWEHYPTTFTVKTGVGGFYLSYIYSGIGNKTRIFDKTDVRCDGGYVVAPPSLHASGNKYEFYRKEDEQPFPYQMFNVKPQETKFTNWTELLSGTSQGSRNDTATKVIGKILNSINPLDWNTTAWEMFVLWNGRNNPPLAEKELRGVFNSIVGTRIRSGEVKIDQPDSDCDIKKISEIAKGLTDDMTVSYPTGFKMIDSSFMGGLKDGDLFFITGFSGHGKTFLIQTITHNLVKAGHPCLWFSFEVPIGELWRKFKNMGVDENFEAYSPEKNTILDLTWVSKKIIEARDRFKTKIIFIDHLGYLSQEPKNYDPNLASNYATILTMICRKLKTLAIQEGVAIVLAGHLRKPLNGQAHDPTMHDIKDSAGVAQESDAVIIINRERAERGSSDLYKMESTVKIEKNRRTGSTRVFKVILNEGRLVDTDVVFDNISKQPNDLSVDF